MHAFITIIITNTIIPKYSQMLKILKINKNHLYFNQCDNHMLKTNF